MRYTLFPHCLLRVPQLALLACLAIGLAGSAAHAANIEGDRATFDWQEAGGPVAGYHVFVTRNGTQASAPELSVAGASATVSGAVGDTILVRVAAFDSAGNQGPLSPSSESVLLVSAEPPPAPTPIVFDATADTSIHAARQVAAGGEQVVVHMTAEAKVLLDAAIPDEVALGDDLWGLDQLVVGAPDEPSLVRLVDSIGLSLAAPMTDLPDVTLFGLGSGEPCERDGAPGLIVHAGSRLVLGGVGLYAFDGEECVDVNALFGTESDPNVITWGEGEIALHGDLEEDGVLDPEDNCLLAANPDQCDGDADGFGNLCDYDINDDGVTDHADVMAVLDAAGLSSTDPRYDINCDGAAALDDLSQMLDSGFAPSGPSGLACAADATCQED